MRARPRCSPTEGPSVRAVKVRVWAALVLFLPWGVAVATGDGACVPGPSGSGQATFFSTTGTGNCALPFTDADFGAAVAPGLYQGSAACGRCARVTGPLGTVTVRIVDQCPTCAANDLDLTPSAFAAIGTPSNGIEPVTWQVVDCPVSGPIAFLFQGSNPFFLKLQVRNHRYGVAGMAIQTGATYAPMTRVSDNFFQYAPGSSILFPINLRLTDVNGAAIDDTITGAGPVNDVVIQGTAQFPFCSAIILVDGFESG